MPRPPASSFLPSLNFLLLCLAFAGSGAALWHGWISGRVAVLLFVLAGWVVSLCLHEFAHALVAWRGGDRAIPATGYLSLDPLRYADPFLSILLPLLFVVVGGFGLPGGAVWVHHSALRGRVWDAAVSAAGPLANLLCLVALAALYARVPPDAATDVGAALAALAFFQATAVVLNLLPIPGFDGYGMLRPFLPGHVRAAGEAFAAGAGAILILLVFLVPELSLAILRAGLWVTTALGFGPHEVLAGIRALRLF